MIPKGGSMKLRKLPILIFLMGLVPFAIQADTDKQAFKEHLDEVSQRVPGIRLISDRLEYEGLIIKDFHFDSDRKYTVVKPGETIEASMSYEIDSSQLDALSLQHYLYGLYPDGPIDCLVHSMGTSDDEGQIQLRFKAPKKAGVYEMRICRSNKGWTFGSAKFVWHKKDNPPNTVIGIVVVE